MVTMFSFSLFESRSDKGAEEIMTHLENPQEDQQTNLFAGLKASILEHSRGNFLRLKDGESEVVTVAVDQMAADANRRTPREEEVDNFAKTAKVWKLRLDCRVGSTNKVFHVRAQDKADVLALLERGVRRIKIARFGSTAKNTKYVFTEA
jgi:hypothetical protein